MKIYFSDGAFYFDNHNTNIPDDAIEVTQEKYDSLYVGQANGQMIATGPDGAPVLRDKPLPTHKQLVSLAEQKQQSLTDTAMQSISVLQMKLLAGRMLTDAETTRLNAVLDYIDAVQVIDTSTAPDINWPEFPVA